MTIEKVPYKKSYKGLKWDKSIKRHRDKIKFIKILYFYREKENSSPIKESNRKFVNIWNFYKVWGKLFSNREKRKLFYNTFNRNRNRNSLKFFIFILTIAHASTSRRTNRFAKFGSPAQIEDQFDQSRNTKGRGRGGRAHRWIICKLWPTNFDYIYRPIPAGRLHYFDA